MAKKRSAPKGQPGKGTGAAARSQIRRLESAGLTQAQIGKAARRSASVISAIKSGAIKNPPESLVARLRQRKAK